jgi:hypothetical protein
LPFAGSLSELRRCLNPLPSPALVETSRISQVPGQPLREHALLFDPGGPNASGHYDALGVAFRSVDDVGSAIGHLSRLNHTACSLAVYASRLGLLRSHHARLASRWRPTLAGQDLNLLGCFRRFLSVMSPHITSIPLRQALPGAPTAVTPPRWRRSRRLGRRAEAGPCQLLAVVSRCYEMIRSYSACEPIHPHKKPSSVSSASAR